MGLRRTTTDALEIMYRDVLKGDPERIKLVEQHRLNMEVSSLIYELRTKAGLSQVQLAKMINTTQSVISRLEDADYEGHSLSMLAKIAYVLGHQLVISAQRLKTPVLNTRKVHSKSSARKQHKLAKA